MHTFCFPFRLIAAFFLISLGLFGDESRASRLSRSIWQKDHSIGLTRDQLLDACRFIESRGDGRLKHAVFSKKRTGLHCVIERSRPLNGFLLTHLGHTPHIGRGVHKVVSKAILYTDQPKIVAVCNVDESGASEIEILEKLQGCRGIVQLLGYKRRSNQQFTIYLEHLSGGSLHKMLKAGYRFTTRQKLAIAYDVMSGLRAMHEQQLVHGDLHSGNILLRRLHSGLFKAVLIDFGRTIDVRRKEEQPVPQGTTTRNPPETLRQPFSSMNRFLVDVYAMGLNFHAMVWKPHPSWVKVFNVYVLHRTGTREKMRLYHQMIRLFKREKKRRIGALLSKQAKGGSLNRYEKFKVLIYEMLSSNPEDRPSANTVCERLLAIGCHKGKCCCAENEEAEHLHEESSTHLRTALPYTGDS